MNMTVYTVHLEYESDVQMLYCITKFICRDFLYHFLVNNYVDFCLWIDDEAKQIAQAMYSLLTEINEQ